MRNLFGPISALLWKDIVLEARTKDIVVAMLIFSLLIILVFNFAIDPAPQRLALVAPGILWIAFVFGGVLGLTRSFALEKENSNMHGLMLAPVSRDTIFFGKTLAIFLLMLLVEAVVLPIFAVFYNLSLATPELVPVIVLATLGIATVGTVFSAMAVNTRAREVMLPLLFLPVALPIIIAAVEATGVVIQDSGMGDLGRWLPFLATFDAIFLVVCPIAFHLIIED